jgi:PRTRC genetic system protein E
MNITLFTTMAALVARGVKLTITVSQAEGDKIEVGILPTSESGTTAVALVPRSFVATPAEFDAEFPQILAGFCQANASLKDQLAAVQVLTEQAAREASEKAVKAPTATTTRKPTSTSSSQVGKAKPEPELLGGGEDDNDAEDESSDQSGSDSANSGTPTGAQDPVAAALQLDL